MDKNQLARYLLEIYITEDGSVKYLTGSSAKAIKELFEGGDIIVQNPQDLENLISSIDELNLSGLEKLALKNLSNTYKEQYPSVLAQSIDKKNEKVNIETKERESLNTIRGNLSSAESSEKFIMSEQLIQEAVNRNTYNTKYNSEEQIREVCSKINYTRESLGNGREKHTINGKIFSFPNSDEFTFADMKLKGKYTMDIVSEKGKEKYNNFQTDTGMNKLNPDKLYDILGEFAQAMNITSTIDYNFFKGNSAESQGLLQMFRNITGFEGRIPLNITNNGKVIEYLCCDDDSCGFDGSISGYDDSIHVAFLSGL